MVEGVQGRYRIQRVGLELDRTSISPEALLLKQRDAPHWGKSDERDNFRRGGPIAVDEDLPLLLDKRGKNDMIGKTCGESAHLLDAVCILTSGDRTKVK